MISFKQFLSETVSKTPDYIELPSFAEIRHKKKAVTEDWHPNDESSLPHPREIHRHEKVRPSEALDRPNLRHQKAIFGYTSVSGKASNGHQSAAVMNQKLLNDAGIQSATQFDHQFHDFEVHDAINELSDTIRHPENRNRIPVTMFSGIHPTMGEKIRRMAVGETNKIPKFSSATSDYHNVAIDFAEKYLQGQSPYPHVVRIHCHPGSGMSVADPILTQYPDEREFLLDHGTKIRKTKESELIDGTWIHHLEACHRNDNAIQ